MGNKVKIQKTKNEQYIITIPKAIAESMGFDQGTQMEFVVNERGEMLLRRVISERKDK